MVLGTFQNYTIDIMVRQKVVHPDPGFVKDSLRELKNLLKTKSILAN